MYTFVTGGYRSGRTNYALRRASELGPPPWLYVSAGHETDDAIHKRLERHRRDAEAIWRSAPMPTQLGDLVAAGALDGVGAAVLDGITGWLESRLHANGKLADTALLDEVNSFVDRLSRLATPVVVVSTEMSFGLPPTDPKAQRFLKIAASVNQIFAEQSSAMVLMVSGAPLRLR